MELFQEAIEGLIGQNLLWRSLWKGILIMFFFFVECVL